MKRTLIYHYHAFYQLETGEITNFDGIATYKSPILTIADYEGLKKLISPENTGKLIIGSLNLISDATIED